jgi:condensin-2 complex subunit G2
MTLCKLDLILRCVGAILQYIWPSIKLLILTSKGHIVPSFYGSALLTVWRKESLGEGVEKLSLLIEDMVQELLQQAIHSPKTAHFILLRACLLSFVEGSRNSQTHAMLRKVYGPLLWRSLRSANALVRAQASVLFFDVFPLHDSHGGAEEDDALLQRQFELLSALLTDDDHRVRANAASGGCHILSQHWVSLPQKTRRDILSHLIKMLSVDHFSVNVRLAVIRGLSSLLEHQPLSHEFLRKLLPFLTDSIHDSSEKVRVEFLGLLMKVIIIISIIIISIIIFIIIIIIIYH